MIALRIMRKDIHYTLSPFWFSMGLAFVCPLFFINQLRLEPFTTTYTLELCGLIAIISLSLFFAQLLLSRAYQLEKAARVATINYLQIVTAFLWDFLFFNTKLKSTDIIGSVIIIFFIFIVTIARATGYIK
jgi:drug/metabolite transporter (DMT)-like permease